MKPNTEMSCLWDFRARFYGFTAWCLYYSQFNIEIDSLPNYVSVTGPAVNFLFGEAASLIRTLCLSWYSYHLGLWNNILVNTWLGGYI